MSGKHSNISIFVPHIGCKNKCSFCNQRHITGTFRAPNASDVKIAVKNALKSKNYNPKTTEIAFFGGSFTAIPKETQLMYLEAVSPYIKSGAVDSVRLSTRPDYIDDETLLMLREHSVGTIELGAQSMDDDVLLAAGRGHTAKDTEKASELIRAYGFELGLQTMTGLPGASFESDLYTAERIIGLQPDIVRIYPTVVIRDTFLHKMEHLAWIQNFLLLDYPNLLNFRPQSVLLFHYEYRYKV